MTFYFINIKQSSVSAL